MVQKTTTVTAKLGGTADWTAEVGGLSSGSKPGTSLKVYWQPDVSGLADGTYTVTVSSTGHDAAEADLVLNSNDTPPVVSLLTPEEGAVVQAPLDIRGTIDDDPAGQPCLGGAAVGARRMAPGLFDHQLWRGTAKRDPPGSGNIAPATSARSARSSVSPNSSSLA